MALWGPPRLRYSNTALRMDDVNAGRMHDRCKTSIRVAVSHGVCYYRLGMLPRRAINRRSARSTITVGSVQKHCYPYRTRGFPCCLKQLRERARLIKHLDLDRAKNMQRKLRLRRNRRNQQNVEVGARCDSSVAFRIGYVAPPRAVSCSRVHWGYGRSS